LEQGISLRVLGRIELGRGEPQKAKAALARSLELLEELRSEYEAARTKAALAELTTEEPARTRYLQEAMAAFRRLGARADLESKVPFRLAGPGWGGKQQEA
jgi:hypothetical protein